MLKIILADGREITPAYTSLKIEENLTHGILSDIGAIVVKEVNISIPNEDGTFSPENSNSKYYPHFKEGITLLVDGEKYIVSKIEAPRTSIVANITAFDPLSLKLEAEVNMPIVWGISGAEAISAFIRKLGFEVDYKTEITGELKCFIPQNSVKETLSAFSLAFNVFFVYENDKISVYSLNRGRDSSIEINTYENASELSTRESQRMSAKVEYISDITLSEQTELASMTVELFPNGDKTVQVKYEDAVPTLIKASENVDILITEVTNRTCTFIVKNTEKVMKTCQLKLYGKLINVSKSNFGAGEENITSVYLQSQELASGVYTRYNSFLQQKHRMFQFNALLDSRIRAGDGVQLRSAYIDDIGIISEVELTAAAGSWQARGKAIRRVAEYKPVFLMPKFICVIAIEGSE